MGHGSDHVLDGGMPRLSLTDRDLDTGVADPHPMDLDLDRVKCRVSDLLPAETGGGWRASPYKRLLGQLDHRTLPRALVIPVLSHGSGLCRKLITAVLGRDATVK
jgi:hypothetical protein